MGLPTPQTTWNLLSKLTQVAALIRTVPHSYTGADVILNALFLEVPNLISSFANERLGRNAFILAESRLDV
jgi:hypothetical protein